MSGSQISPDGKSFWDGQRWVPFQQPAQSVQSRFSADGLWWWNGSEWVPANQAPAPPPPPQSAAAPAAGRLPAPAVAGGAIAVGGAGLMYQFGGPAAWSIGFGVASIVAPLFAGFYFQFLPLLGLVYAARAFQRGRPIGAAVGVVVNIVGGLVSLIEMGVIFR